MKAQITAYRLRSDVVFQPMDDDAIIVSLNSEEIYKLNHTGTQIVKLIEEQKSVPEIIDALKKIFKIDVTDLTTEVMQLLNELQKANLIEEISNQ